MNIYPGKFGDKYYTQAVGNVDKIYNYLRSLGAEERGVGITHRQGTQKKRHLVKMPFLIVTRKVEN